MPLVIVRISVYGQVGEVCVSSDKGEIIYNLLHKNLIENNNEVELDFVGVRAITASFLTAAIRELLKDIPLEEIQRRLKTINLDDVSRESIALIIEDSAKYYTDPNYRSVSDKFWQDLMKV